MKKIFILAAIIIVVAVVGAGCSKDTSTPPKTTSLSAQSKNLPLGTQATTKTGRIYVNMGKTFKGITGMNDSQLLMVMPELSGGGYDIGSYGVLNYNSTMTNETLVQFFNDIVTKSNCNYIVLINAQDPKEGISLSSAGTLSKGVVTHEFNDYTIQHDTELALIDKTDKTFTWQKA
ncbi:hypothetical protein [uncultured Clostridium sp.]|uniref:hypothetical protein n=1 Tax=uncultured Clostridium sp. TaxID=59620 RepID=UPI00262EF4F4|nr:hypothetical protein [uncultured Clostridium sp.]